MATNRDYISAALIILAVILILLAQGCGGNTPAPAEAPPNPTITPSPVPLDEGPLVRRRLDIDISAPTPTPTVEVAAMTLSRPQECYSSDAVRAVLVDVGWPASEIETALTITYRESRWCMVVNWGDQKDGLGSRCWFQLASLWFRFAGTALDEWDDPYVCAATALAAWEHSGWYPWRTQ